MTSTDGKTLATIKAPGQNPAGLSFDGEHLWVPDRQQRKVYRLNQATGEVVFSIAFDGELAGTAWDGTHVWQADRTSRTISRIDPETGMIALSLAIDLATGDVTGLHYENGGIWYGLARLGQARKVRESDGRFMRAIPTKSDIGGLVVVGRHLFYTEPTAGLLHKMDAQAGTILISYNIGGKPTGLCHDGTAFWIADAQTAELRRVQF